LVKNEILLPYSADLLKDIQRLARAPANITDEPESASNRRLYFSILYQQYKMLSSHLGTSTSIKFCPQFHTERVNADAVSKTDFLIQGYKIDSVQNSFFPEQIFQGGFSFHDYQQNIQEELVTLCDEGVSDNFYKFDNLMTYHVNRTDFHKGGSQSMEALLKIPIYANFYLFRMIQAQTLPYPHNAAEKNLINVSHVHWFEQYVNEAREVRESLMNNKTVQR
jgi:hypothetical protein